MSRVAKAPVILPKNVELSYENGNVTVKGPKGQLTQHCHRFVSVERSESDSSHIEFKPACNEPKAWAHAGTVRALVQNMVNGVTNGYDRSLELVGVGYRAQAKGSTISLSLGFSHPIEYHLPEGVHAETPTNTLIILKGIDKQKLGQVASEIRGFRPPEPYKGKGVKYASEVIKRKEAKKK